LVIIYKFIQNFRFLSHSFLPSFINPLFFHCHSRGGGNLGLTNSPCHPDESQDDRGWANTLQNNKKWQGGKGFEVNFCR